MSYKTQKRTNRQPTNIRNDKDDTTLRSWIVRPVAHEFGAHLHYTNGLASWHGLREQLGIDAETDITDEEIAPVKTTMTCDGQRWMVMLTPKDSGFLSEWVDADLLSIPEFVIGVEDADHLGNASPRASFRVSPRTPDTPGPGWTGINVHAQGSNLEPETYPQLLDAATEALGIDVDLSVEAMEESSTPTTFELYVRLRASAASALYGDEGPFRRIMQHVATTSDYRKLEEDRRDERSYRDIVAFDSTSARTLIDGHSLGKEMKLYDAATPPSDPDRPLHHPKLCVRYVGGITNRSVYWDDFSTVKRELNEFLINTLDWTGITPIPASDDSTGGPSAFMSDEHFDATAELDPAEYDIQLIEDPLPEIRRIQQNSVKQAIVETSATPAQREALEVIADGGYRTEPNGPGMHYEEIADEAGRSVASIYRLLDEVGDVLRSDAGWIKMASWTIVDQVRSWFGGADEPQGRGDESSAQSSAEDTADHQTGNAPSDTKTQPAARSPWFEWCHKHGVTDSLDHDTIAEKGRRDGPAQWKEIDLGELPVGWSAADLQRHIHEGFEAWKASNRPEGTYKGARFRWREYGADESDETIGMSVKRRKLEPDRDPPTQLKSVRR